MDEAASGSRRQHPTHAALGDEKRGPHVKAHHAVVVILRHLLHRLGTVGAGVVHQNIEARAVLKKSRDGRKVADIERRGLGAATCRADRRSRGFYLAPRSRDQRDAGTGFCQSRSQS